MNAYRRWQKRLELDRAVREGREANERQAKARASATRCMWCGRNGNVLKTGLCNNCVQERFREDL